MKHIKDMTDAEIVDWFDGASWLSREECSGHHPVVCECMIGALLREVKRLREELQSFPRGTL